MGVFLGVGNLNHNVKYIIILEIVPRGLYILIDVKLLGN